jgi:hypothetical protein
MSIFTQGVKFIAKNTGKIIRGIKQSAPAIVKGVKGSTVSIGKGLKSAGSATVGLLSRTASSTGQAVSSATQTAKNTASAVTGAVTKAVQNVKNLFKAKPQGVVVEKVIQKGGPQVPKKPVLRTRVREGNFNSTSDSSLGIKEIEKVVKKNLAVKDAIPIKKIVKPAVVKPAVIKPQKDMAYI